jgi:hypothetical protein
MGVKIGDTTDYDCWVLVRSDALFGGQKRCGRVEQNTRG